MKPQIKVNAPDDAKFHNILDMALGFSGMIRLFEGRSKEKFRAKMIEEIPIMLSITSEDEFINSHTRFSRWGVDNIVLAEKRRNGKIIKRSGPASYGQIAKTLNVVLKVVVHYCRLPNEKRASEIEKWLDAAVDTKMMAYLKSTDKNIRWPTTIEQVGEDEYQNIKGSVYAFIQDKHDDKIIPVEFDDMYWEALNKEIVENSC